MKKEMANPFPMVIVYESHLPTGGKMTHTLGNIRKLDIPDSMFEVPEGYRVMPMPRTSSELRKKMEELEPDLPLPKKTEERQP